MTLRPVNAEGSQRFYVPENPGVAGDLSLVYGGGRALPSVRPIGRPRIFGPRAVDNKNAPGLWWVKLEWDDLRGPFMQYGPAEEALHSSSLSQLVADDYGILRHFFLTSSQATPDPASASRIVHCNVFGVLVIATGGSTLFRETSSTDPTIITVAGFTPAGGNSGINSVRRVLINSVPYLAICYAGGGANTLELLSDLVNPPTSVVPAIGATQTYDVIQVPVYSDALLILQNNSILRAPTANVAPGALVFTPVETVPRGGYWIGIMGAGVGVGTPSVAGVFPVGDPVNVVTPPAAGNNFPNKGKILLFQLSGQLLGELPVKTPWVTNATKFADGIVYCDQTTHFYWDGRQHIPMLRSQDRYPDSNFVRVCQGHYVKGDKFFWVENYTKSPSGTGNTVQYWMEYDLYTNTSKNVSFPVDLGVTGPQTYGGNNLPVSEQTEHLHCYAAGAGRWYRQYQSPASFRGFDQRKTSGAAAGTGQEYEPTGTWVSTNIEITGFEAAAKVVARSTGPLNSSLQAGGTGGTPAYLDCGVTGQGGWQFKQEAGLRDRRLIKDFPLGMNSAFRGPVQLTIQSIQQAGGTDPTRFTTNILPISIEMFMYQKGVEYSPEYRNWDAMGVPV